MNATQQLENKLGILKFQGYHRDDQLPFKRGERVKVPKGTFVASFNPKYEYDEKHRSRGFYLKRDTFVTIHHFGCGQNVPQREYEARSGRDYAPGAPIIETEYGPAAATMNPSIVWVGSGSYWHEADINDVISALEVK